MCGRFTVLTYEEVAAVADAVERRLSPVRLTPLSKPRDQAFPGSIISLISPSETGTLEISNAVWGFQTEWSKRPIFNTRIESATGDTAMWREVVEQGRCIVPVATFFEPHAHETLPSPRTGKPMKKPYEFADPAGAPLLLAGVQTRGRCSIVTCEPNRWVTPIHNRMPLIMRFQEAETWLSPDWRALANRGDFAPFELHVQPEQLQPPQSDQLSLFS